MRLEGSPAGSRSSRTTDPPAVWLAFVRVTFATLPTQVSRGGCIRTACVCTSSFEVQNPLCLSCLANQECPCLNRLKKKKKKEVGLSVLIRRKGSFKSLGDDYQERWSSLNIHLLSGLRLLGLFILLPTLIELFFPSYPLALKIWTKVTRLH